MKFGQWLKEGNLKNDIIKTAKKMDIVLPKKEIDNLMKFFKKNPDEIKSMKSHIGDLATGDPSEDIGK